MAAGRPVLCSFDLDSELCKIVLRTHCGIATPAGDVQSLKNAIIELKNHPNLRATMGENGRQYLQTYLNKHKCVSEYIRLFTELSDDKLK